MKPLYYIPLSIGWSWLVTDQTWRFLEVIIKEVTAFQQPAPYQYRILVPFALKPIGEAVGYFIPVFVFWWLVLAFLVLFLRQIGQHFGIDKDNQIALFTAVGIIPALTMFHPAPAFGNGLEAVFFAAALLLILRGKTWPLYPLVFVATFNRETTLFIVVMYFLVTRNWKHGIGLVLVWTAVYVGLRQWIGIVPNDVTLAEVWAINIASLPKFGLGLVFVYPLLVYAWKGWKVATAELKRAAWVVPLYLAFVAVGGVWAEWRLLLTVYPLIVPLVGRGISIQSHSRFEDSTKVYLDIDVETFQDGWQLIDSWAVEKEKKDDAML